jgi:rhamnosyltransferase
VTPSKIPHVAILLATYNGLQYLPEQLQSIALQEGVKVTLFISDDGSTDGTQTIIKSSCSELGIEYVLLPTLKGTGSAGKNFFRLIRDVNMFGIDYFAFADQDDIWFSNKLLLSIQTLNAGADGVSSNVTAFWSNGVQKSVIKDLPQKPFDYLFQSAGPGCTYVVTATVFTQLQLLANKHEELFNKCELHDWATYAITRGLGFRWEIMSTSTMLYRQHATNAFGSRKGLSAILKRINMIRQGWMHEQVSATIDVVEKSCPMTDVSKIKTLISNPTMANKIKLSVLALKFRRKKLDSIVLSALILSGLFWPKKQPTNNRNA